MRKKEDIGERHRDSHFNSTLLLHLLSLYYCYLGILIIANILPEMFHVDKCNTELKLGFR